MIARLIRWSITNRFLVLMATLMVAAWGIWSLGKTPLDALPDLSDVQVIIRTTWPGQAPQIVEDQVTYPLTTTMLSVPGAKTVRGYSFFGDSFVYVLFEDGTDPYWARSRVLEYLNQVQSRLPSQARASLGPDATGVGWVYEYALVDHSGKLHLAQLRALQDWFMKYELKTVPNVSEVASIGGMVRQYQIVLDPDRLRAYNIPHSKVIEAIGKANQEAGGSVLELGEAEYMVRASGYLQSLDDFRKIPLMTTEAGVSVRLGDVARVQIGPEMRRGIAELNGEGEVAGGVIVMRSGKNALETIKAVKAKLAALKASLPPGVEIVPTYDRSGHIDRRIHRRHNRVRHLSFSSALRAGCNRVTATGYSCSLHRHALSRGECEHHVAGRHRNRDWCHGRCGGGDDRECAQAHRRMETHPSRPDLGGQRPMGRDCGCRSRSRPGIVLLSADHHVLVYSGVCARSPGRTAVLAIGVHQDLCNGRRRRAFGHTDPGADGLSDPGQNSRRAEKPDQPFPDPHVSSFARRRAAPAQDNPAGGGLVGSRNAMARQPSGRRVYASAGRGGFALYANGIAWN